MTEYQRLVTAAAIILCLMQFFGSYAASAAEPKRVLLLHSFGREFKPWSDYAISIRRELERQSPWPLDVTDHSLVSARSGDDDPEVPFVEYLGALFAKHPPDLIVSIGAPAAAFVQRHRQRLFTITPMIFTAVEQRRVRFSDLTANDAVVSVRIDYLAAIRNILQVLPDTDNVTVVVGTSPIEKFWKEAIAKEVKPLAGRVAFSWTDGLSFQELLRRAATLPPKSAIFWELMIVDAAGIVHEGSAPLTQLHGAARAPIFSYDESFFGSGIVGGPLLLVIESSRQTAAAAIRILGGEKADAINIPPVQFAAPRFDWREMQRWGISESRLPPQSEIYFRDPTLWDQYRAQILAVLAVLVLQSALISWLIYEHRRRHRAEVQSRNSVAELTFMNRRAAAGELSATIAHEVNQPLTGMVARANAALRWLSREQPDIGKARDALDQIVIAGHRASDVVMNVRAMFRKDTEEKRPVDINKLIWSVLGLVYIDLRKHSIETQTDLAAGMPLVLGNEVQLQQVILNLVMNAIEAMNSTEHHVLTIRSQLTGDGSVHVSVEDTGSGIDPSNMNRLFKALFTTKERGMGMGLSICRSIIESHYGRIWVTSATSRGSIFHLTIPMNDKT